LSRRTALGTTWRIYPFPARKINFIKVKEFDGNLVNEGGGKKLLLYGKILVHNLMYTNDKEKVQMLSVSFY